MRGHSRPKDGVASLAYDPRIHETAPQTQSYVRLPLLRPLMDRRVKPGDDAGGYFAGTKSASRSVRLIVASFSMAAKVSDMCSVRPSQSSTWTMECAPAKE
jgi:hypothetical protein